MISVSTNNYFTMLRAAQLQAAREGLPSNSRRFVPVAIEEHAPPPATQNVSARAARVVDVLI